MLQPAFPAIFTNPTARKRDYHSCLSSGCAEKQRGFSLNRQNLKISHLQSSVRKISIIFTTFQYDTKLAKQQKKF